MYDKQKIAILIFFIVLLFESFVVSGAGSVHKVCPFDPSIIECTPIVCEGSKFTRLCRDITGCLYDGKEFERKGPCQSDYIQKPKETVEEKNVQQFVNYEDEFPSINENDIELISADLIKGNGENNYNVNQNNEGLVFDNVLEEVDVNVDDNGMPIIPYVIAFVLLLCGLFVYVRKRRSQFDGFSKEIGKMK